jgi:hypothetical protein
MVSTAAAFARSAGGKARKSMAVPTGVSMPPPTPCSTRNAISDSTLQARPQRIEASVNTERANMNVRLVPNRSPAQPLTGMKTARLRR